MVRLKICSCIFIAKGEVVLNALDLKRHAHAQVHLAFVQMINLSRLVPPQQVLLAQPVRQAQLLARRLAQQALIHQPRQAQLQLLPQEKSVPFLTVAAIFLDSHGATIQMVG